MISFRYILKVLFELIVLLGLFGLRTLKTKKGGEKRFETFYLCMEKMRLEEKRTRDYLLIPLSPRSFTNHKYLQLEYFEGGTTSPNKEESFPPFLLQSHLNLKTLIYVICLYGIKATTLFHPKRKAALQNHKILKLKWTLQYNEYIQETSKGNYKREEHSTM